MEPTEMRGVLSAIQARARGSTDALDFHGVDLRGAALPRAELSGANLEAALLDHANLSGARLSGCALAGASARGTELNGTDLGGADLSTADLEGARIEGASFKSADLRGASLRDSRGKPASVAGMKLDHAAYRRSEMTEAELIQLWRDGATIEDLERFPERVRHACRARSLAPPASSAKVGDVVLGVTLRELIGQGQNGNVFKGSDAEGRTVAVKLFDAERLQEAEAETFKRGTDTLNRAALLDERQTARVVRPAAVAVNGLAFVYDYYDNGNLAGIPALGWDVQRLVAFFSAICSSVGELHELGLLHRSLKPTNVLVDDDIRPVLSDVGMRALPDHSRALNAAEAIYSAPEELSRQTTYSPTADIYSLGRLLCFLLLGRDPDDSTNELGQLEKTKPPGLVRIIRKATAYDPALRYQWVQELEADLVRYELRDAVGMGDADVDRSKLPYTISSLPAPAPKRAEVRLAPAPAHDAPAARKLPSSVERVLASAGALSAVGAGAWLAVTPAPSPSAAHLVGVVASVGLAVATLFLPANPQRPLASRLIVAAAVFGVLSMLELERLATLRWKATLASGDIHERALVVRALSRRGVKDLRGAELPRAELGGADLGNANLGGANLTGANLAGANLAETDLTGTKLAGANLSRADLSFSQVERAVGLKDALCDGFTTLPSQWSCVDGRPSVQIVASD